MKKLFTLLFVAAFLVCQSTGILAQSQRLVLIEEFTQASCPPCATQNPTFNTLLQANLTKVVPIKYQTSWPGVDPMNAQNGPEVATRVTYYSITGVPMARADGDTMAFYDATHVWYTGAPHNLTQAAIDAEYAVASPFTMALSHTFSSAYDSVYITLDITCTQAFTANGALKARIGLTENEIPFCSAPGTNGETDFSEVMRKMYPSASGTVMSGTWTVGQTQHIAIGAVLPTYIYDKNTLAVVAWIQDDGNKSVQQAAFSAPQQMPVDAGLKDCAPGSVVSCNPDVNTSVTVHNYGVNALTSGTINWQVDGGSVSSQPWTGSIASGSTASVVLPTITVTSGSHTIHFYFSNPNGVADHNANNDFWNLTANIFAAPTATPVAEAFTAPAYPPTNWLVDNVDGDTYQWARAAASIPTGSSGSSKLDFYNSPNLDVDNLDLPPVNLTTAVAGSTLQFDVAHRQYSTSNDRLKVNVSTNCGATWTTVYNKAGATLATTPTAGLTNAFTPTTSQWRHETVSMTPYIGQANVLIQFSGISNFGNNLYVDNVNVFFAPVGIQTLSLDEFVSVYPNPSTGECFLKVNFDKAQDLTVTVTNLIGEVVKTMDVKSAMSGVYPIDLTGQAKGNYFVNIKGEKETITRRIAITQ